MFRMFLISAFATAMLAAPATSNAADGAAVWKSNKCAMCHGDTGKGDSKMGQKKKVDDMTTADWQKKFSDDAIKKAITEGVNRDKDGVKQKMKGYKLAADELDALVKLIRSWAK